MAEAKLRILLFAGAREAAGKKELAVSVAVADEQVSGAQLMQAIIAAEPTLAPFQTQSMLALNEEYIEKDGTPVTIKDGDAIAFIPPLSGG